jgi:hypothetical protein
VLCQVGFESLGKFTPRQEDAPATALAFESDIRAKTCDDPLIGATRVLLSQAKMIMKAKVR